MNSHFFTAARPALRATLRRATQQSARSASSSAPPPLLSRIRSGLISTLFVVGTGAFILYGQDSSAGIHRWAMPVISAATADDPEKAHSLAILMLSSGIAPKDRGVDDERLSLELWGHHISNPIGMAAGFDKHAEAIDGLFDLGFGYVEVGSVTPEPQPGNPKPRVFRIPESNAMVNRYGFNSEGHLSAVARLRNRIRQFVSANALTLPPAIFPSPPENALPNHDVVGQLLASPNGKDALVTDSLGLPRSLKEGKVLAINLGKNKSSAPESIDDFVQGVHRLGPYADFLVVNVSSPNTPGLRALQHKGILEELLSGVITARNSLAGSYKPPVLVKVAPDLDATQLADIASAVLSTGIDGIIVSNTTITRPASAGTASALLEAGGLSGPPVKPLALAALSALHAATDGKIPIIGCGGITTGQDAIDFAKAGASIVQMYTSFIYQGIGFPRKLKDEVTEILRKENTTWAAIIGTGAPKRVTIEPVVVEQLEMPILSAVAQGGESIEMKQDLESLLEELSAASPSTADSSTPFHPPTPAELDSVFVDHSAPVDTPALKPAESLLAPSEILLAVSATSPSTPAPAEPVPVVEATPLPVLEIQNVVVSAPEPVVVEIKAEPVAAKEEGKRWV